MANEQTFTFTRGGTVVSGAYDMLRESAKQFRLLDQTGHARMADKHADNLAILMSQGRCECPENETHDGECGRWAIAGNPECHCH